MGDYALERFFGAFVLFVLFMVVIFKKKLGRIVVVVLFVSTWIGYGVFFGIRERDLQNKYEESIEIVDSYLLGEYPNETWTFDTYVEEGRKLRPFTVKAVFNNEPSVTYIYKVYENNEVVLLEVSIPDNINSNSLKHDENFFH
ncbi:hypothetical protein [Psychrobacillus sp. L3]|uniref:hypothetical protein n=1 Tax=Psychrobacillus sp. L3 TaxID=3236891 RepID=UPI0036F214DF